MTSYNIHYDCRVPGCYIRSAYIRINKNWKRIGTYFTGCKGFEPLKEGYHRTRVKYQKSEKPHEIPKNMPFERRYFKLLSKYPDLKNLE